MTTTATGIGLKRLQHLVLWVSDVERSVRFYCGLLAFEVTHRYPRAAFLKIPGTPDDHHLGLFEQPGVAPPDERVARMYHTAMASIVSALTKCVAAAMVIGTATAHAAEIKVIASAAVKDAVLDLIPAFEKSSGHKVTTIWAGTEAITKRISGGEVVDIVLIAAPNIDKLISEGKLVAGSRADVAKSGIGVAVRAGLPKPDILARAADQPFMAPSVRPRTMCLWTRSASTRTGSVMTVAAAVRPPQLISS
jgi:hypothetical protein